MESTLAHAVAGCTDLTYPQNFPKNSGCALRDFPVQTRRVCRSVVHTDLN